MRWNCIIILLLVASITRGQGLTFRHVTIADGLNNGTINAIEQDSLGRIWLATWDGLMQYDGYRVINHKPVLGDSLSLPSKRCIKVSRDSRQNLWVSTTRGLCRYDATYDRFIRYSFQGLSPESPVRTEVVAYRDQLLVRAGGNVYYLPADQLDLHVFRSIRIIGAENLTTDRFVRYLFANDRQVLLCFRIRGPENKWMTQVFNGRILNDSIIRIDDQPDFLVPGNVRDMKINGKKVYLGTDAGFAAYDYDNDLLVLSKEFEKFRITSLVLGSDGFVWLGADQHGLICYHPDKEQFDQYEHDPSRINTILGNNIFSLHEDFSGNLLVGHGGAGITILNLKDKRFNTYRYDPQDPGSIGDNTVFCFNEFGDGLLVGTRNKGLYYMHSDPDDGRALFSEIAFPSEFMSDVDAPVVWCIEKESEDLYWIGTVFGLIKAVYRQDQWQFSKYFGNLTFRSVFIDEKGNMWLGSYQGLYVVPTHRRETMDATILTHNASDPSSLSDNVITSFLLDGTDHLWIGTENGGINMLLETYSELDYSEDFEKQVRFQVYSASTEEHMLNNEEINILYEHTDGTIWAGTKGGGINILDPATDQFYAITVENGLAGNNVYGILADNQGRLWFSTNKGLSCYDLITKAFNNYTPSDGIQGSVFMNNSYFKGEDGKMYFGGRNGFTSFYPEEITNNEVAPRFHFNGIEIHGKRVHIGDTINNHVILPESLHGLSSITLSYRERSFHVLFSAIHNQYPGENQVEYYLEGFNDHYTTIDASSGRFIFNNLENGRYLLKAHAGNSDDVWNTRFNTLEIYILPPWYKTRWAVAIFLIIGISLIAGLIRLLLHRQSLSHDLRIEKIEKSNLKELNESKLRFFTNVSHEFRTPLCLTVGPIDNLLRERGNSDYRLSQQLGMASRNAKLLLRLVDQIIDFRRLEAGKIKLQAMEMDMNKYLVSITDNFEPLRKEKDVGLFVNFPDDTIRLWIDPQKIEQVLYNLLSNAFKHVPKEGSIAVTLNRTDHIPGQDEEGSWAQIAVYNDGKTIPEEDMEKVFERFYKVDESQLGSGIGLAYARSLVDLHQGHINVENRQETGVIFNIYLPRGKQHLKEEEFASVEQAYSYPELETSRQEVKIPHVSTAKEKQDLSLLVVEDNDELRDFFRTILAERYDFHEASNGLSGYEIAREVIPDIIITDLLMPEMDGFELCDKIKNNEKTSHIPIILLTAKNTPEDKIAGYKSGADAYVVKPFEISVLEAQIKQLIENRSQLQKRYRETAGGEVKEPENLTKEDHFMNRVKDLIEKDMEDPALNVNKLSEKINLSSTQLYRKIKAVTGHSSVDFIKEYRLVKSATLLKTTDHSVKEICFMTGFKSPSYFVKCFKVKYGQTPREFASNGSRDSTVISLSE